MFRRKQKEIKKDIHGRPIIEEKKEKKKSKAVIPENQELKSIIAPVGITFNRINAVIGDNLARCYGVIRYPQFAEYGWLRRLTNIHGTVAAIHFTPLDTDEVLKSLNNNIRNYRMDANDGKKDELERQRAEQSIRNAEEAMRRIDQNGEVVGRMCFVLMPLAENEKSFDKICKNVENASSIANCKCRKLASEQKEGVKFVLPTYTEENNVHRQTGRMMPISSFVGGFPFASSGFNDHSGFYRGHDGLGGTVYLNSWYRGRDRTNSNYVIAGNAGMGKSATIKAMAIMERALGASIFFVDPEGEYKDLTLNLNGEWLNASGGNGKVINPLQVIGNTKYLSKDDEGGDEDDDDSETITNDLENHMKLLEVFLSLYLKEITQYQMALLKQEIEELYRKFNITWDTDVSKLKNTDFPLFKDLHQHLIDKSREAEDRDNMGLSKEYADLALLLRDISIGSDSFLWGSYTTPEINADVVCVDTFGLNSRPDNIKSAQYFLLQNLAWQRATRSNKERSIIVYEEAHMIIDKDVPQPMKTLSQQERRARKYEAAIWVASQQVNDFVDPAIKQYGSAILNQPTYKLILGMDGQDLVDVARLYRLKEAERELIEQKTRGRALFMIGSRRLDLSIKIDDFKLNYFGDKGGR